MKKKIEVSGAIFICGGKVFAPRRGQSKNPEVAFKYEFAGGKTEPNESPQQAVLRELKEELDLSARVLEPFITVTYEYEMYTVTLHTFLCEMLSEYTLKEHVSAEWIPFPEIDSKLWAPADKAVLAELVKRFA